MIPQDILAQAKQAVQAQWKDTVTVKRIDQESPVVDDEILVCQDKKCHLSVSRQPVQSQGHIGETATIFTLYADVEIKQGDKLYITHKSQRFEGVAGLPFQRDISTVVPVQVVKVS